MNNWDMCEVEFINYRKDGSTFWTRTSLVPVSDGEGGYSHWVAIGRDISQQKKIDLQLTESLKEKNILLSEIHHRVKNNLAVVSGMMQLQAFKEKNKIVQQKLNDSIFRIHTIASIHEILYQSGSFSKLHFTDIIDQLIDKSKAVLEGEKVISVSVIKSPVQLNINQAIPASLIINEVITNIYKHAFIDRNEGNISVILKEFGTNIKIRIEDDGVGITENIYEKKSLGLQIIEILTLQLHGNKKLYNSGNGTVFELNFQKSNVKGAGSAFIS